jgi:general secretion pathway protein J
MMRSHYTRGAGFTLVEVLVALLVMSILAGMAWQGIDGMVRARDATQTRLSQTLRLSTVLAQWDVDLGALQDTGVMPALGFDGRTLLLTRRTEAGIQLVAWSLSPQEDGQGQRWLRWASPVVTRSNELQEHWMRSQQFQGAEPGQLQLLDGLAQWQLYFYYVNGWANAQSSGETDSVNGNSPRQLLPTGVRLVLQFQAGSGREGTLTRDIALGPQQE